MICVPPLLRAQPSGGSSAPASRSKRHAEAAVRGLQPTNDRCRRQERDRPSDENPRAGRRQFEHGGSIDAQFRLSSRPTERRNQSAIAERESSRAGRSSNSHEGSLFARDQTAEEIGRARSPAGKIGKRGRFAPAESGSGRGSSSRNRCNAVARKGRRSSGSSSQVATLSGVGMARSAQTRSARSRSAVSIGGLPLQSGGSCLSADCRENRRPGRGRYLRSDRRRQKTIISELVGADRKGRARTRARPDRTHDDRVGRRHVRRSRGRVRVHRARKAGAEVRDPPLGAFLERPADDRALVQDVAPGEDRARVCRRRRGGSPRCRRW